MPKKFIGNVKGVGIASAVREYYNSTSESSVTGGTWQTTVPTLDSSHYLWTRLKLTLTNGKVEITDPIREGMFGEEITNITASLQALNNKTNTIAPSNVVDVAHGGTGETSLSGIKTLLGLAKAAFVDLVTVALGGTGKTSHTSNAVLTGNGTSAVKNVATANGAFYATSANGAAQFGTLPVRQGGTGATNPENARANLDLGSVATRDTVPISMGGTGATSAEDARIALGLRDFASKTYVNEQSGNKAVIKRVWSNPSSTAEFQGGNVGLEGTTVYDIVMIVFRSSRTDATTHTAFARRGARGVVTRIGNIDNADNNLLFAKREFEFDGRSVSFGTCTFRQNTVNVTNDYLIPIEIYGIDNIQY